MSNLILELVAIAAHNTWRRGVQSGDNALADLAWSAYYTLWLGWRDLTQQNAALAAG